MTAELSQFYQVFFDEAAEHLANMEALLLALDVAAPSGDDLNAIFRAAHSIKGGAGTFGFHDMAEVTHELETLLDRLRKSELQLAPAMIDAFLRAGDVIKAQLDAHRGGAAADPRDAEAVRATLQALAQADAPQPAAARCLIRITVPLAHERLAPVLADLQAHGTLEVLDEPAAGSAGPWLLAVTTAANAAQLRELFEFVADPAAVEIDTAEAPAADPGYGLFDEATPAPAAAADPGYGFFDAAPLAPAPAAAAADPGYGFFDDVPGAPAAPSAQPPRQGRRAADDPAAPVVPTGRRASDKVAVSAQAETSSIRVNTEKVDQLINLVGELVITQAMLAQSAAALDPVLFEKLVNGLSQLDRNTRDLQDAVMSIRMMPMSFVFSRFPRVVRELAGKLGKEIELRTEGETTELDKGVIEKIADPLTHLVRNSIDHGIEMPEARLAAGKVAKGTVTLRAFHQGGNIIIEVEDDGAGLNRERILAKARERGMAVADTMTDQDVWQLIFEAGFSTAAAVTDVSGRGVGMDVVKRNIRALGGRVEIDSEAGAGTRIRVRLPLTLAILDGLSVTVGEEMFIVPLACIIESLQPRAEDVKSVAGSGSVVHVRGEYLPMVALHEVFSLPAAIQEPHRGIVVILEAEGRKVAMFVDALVAQHQVVIKSLETNYRRVEGISGATIMGDGHVALILDAVALGRMAPRALALAA